MPSSGLAGLAELRADLAEQARLDLADAVLGVEHQRLVFLHFRGDVALGVDQGLLADVVGWGQAGVGAGDLDVVAKDLVVADLERLDPGALALDALQVGDPIAGMARGLDDVVQLAGIAGADHAGVLQGGGRFVGDGGFQQVQLVFAQGCSPRRAGASGPSGAGNSSCDTGQARSVLRMATRSRGMACPEMTRLISRSRSASGLQRGAQLGAQHAIVDAGRPPRPGAGDLLQVRAAACRPTGDQALAHRGDGVIQHARAASLHLALADGLGQLQVAPGGGIQHHELVQAVGGDAGQQAQRGGLGLLQVLQDRPGGAHGLRSSRAGQSHPVRRPGSGRAGFRWQRAGFEAPGGQRVRCPGRPSGRSDVIRDEDFGRVAGGSVRRAGQRPGRRLPTRWRQIRRW